MNRVFFEAWRTEVIDQMTRRLPQFGHVESSRNKSVVQRPLKFAWAAKPRLIGGIAFRPIDDSFDVWVGWSTTGKHPYTAAQEVQFNGDIWDFSAPAILQPTLTFAGRSGVASWQLWQPAAAEIDDPAKFASAFLEFELKRFTEEEAKVLISPMVEQAMAEIVEFCIPYLEQRVEVG